MSQGGFTVFDGAHLRSIDPSLSLSHLPITGHQLLDLAHAKASSSLFGFSLPENLKSSALKRLGIDDAVSFRCSVFTPEQASLKLKDYINALADELKDDPLFVSILDGNTLGLFLEDEDDFAMLAENLFTDLDTDDIGKIHKGEIRNALVHMGVEMGVPPFSEFPQLNDILRKHVIEGEEELGQAQFAQLLQAVLEELGEALAEKPVVFVQHLKFIDGSKLRKLLVDEKQLSNVVEKILLENHIEEDGQESTEITRRLLEKIGKETGLPPPETNEALANVYDAVFADVENTSVVKMENNELREIIMMILEKFADQLEASPVLFDLDK